MQGKPEIIVLIVVAIVAMLALDWGNDHPQRYLRAAVTPAATPVTSPEAVGTELPRSVILAEELRRQFTSPGVRENEAVLLFKNALAYQRFLAREDQTGIRVLGQIAPLFAIRIRISDYHALAAELLVHDVDYDQAAANTMIRKATSADPSPNESGDEVTLVGTDSVGSRILSAKAGDVFTLAQAIVSETDAGSRIITLNTISLDHSEIVDRALAYAHAHHATIVSSPDIPPAQPVAP